MFRTGILFFILLFSCSKESGSPSMAVYVVGVSNVQENLNTRSVAGYWKNGNQFSLPGGAIHSYASSIAISGNDIYVVGNVSDTLNYEEPVIWKNGSLVYLPVPNSLNNKKVNYSKAFSIAISGSDIFVCGSISDNQTFIHAVYWKNGNIILLPDGDEKQAHAISVSGNDVYISAQAGYWKNEVYVSLPNANPANSLQVFSILAIGPDFYLGGTTYNDQRAVATYWKNGTTIVYLPNNTFTYSAVSSMTASGNDIYMAGALTNDFVTYSGVYWKNGSIEEFTGSGNYSPNGIAVVGNDIYAVGTTSVTALYWHNNVSTSLTNCAIANNIVVK